MKNMMTTIIKNIIGNPQVRIVCMAYARNTTRVMGTTLALAVITLTGFILVNHDTTDPKYLFVLKGALVFFATMLPMVPAIIIENMQETYQRRLNAQTA